MSNEININLKFYYSKCRDEELTVVKSTNLHAENIYYVEPCPNCEARHSILRSAVRVLLKEV